jgi:hypothetical protein
MNIEYIRERVIIALANYCGATKGQLAAFEEHAPADTSSKNASACISSFWIKVVSAPT